MSTRHIAAEHARLSDLTPQGSSGGAARRFRQKLAADGFTVDEGFRLKPGYLYTVVRAISARVNQNYDGWPSEELKKSYKTFIGKPVFVNHENHDPTKARGVVVAARYVESGMDKYVEVVQEVDAERFPKLAHEIKTGGLDSVSMGAEAGFTICSYCKNKATDLHDMCDHVKNHKGKTLTKFDRRTGKKEDILVFESCHKISFFELSYVFEPADETAVASKVVVAGKHPDLTPGSGDELKHIVSLGPEGHPDYHRALEQLVHRSGGSGWEPDTDPFDPREFGAARLAAWGTTPHDTLVNSMGDGHKLHVFSPHPVPAIRDHNFTEYAPATGSHQHEWVHTHHGEPVSSGTAGSQEEAIAAAEKSHKELAGGWDPDEDVFDPRQFGAARRYTDADGKTWSSKDEWSRAQNFPWMSCSDCGHNKLDHSTGKHKSYDVYGCTEDGCGCKKFNRQAGKYTKEDFASAGNRKPWESETENDEATADEIEIHAMFHTAGGICMPGEPCMNRIPQGEQITKDSPNNPVNQKSSDPNGTGGGAAGGAGGGGGSPDGDNILPGSRALYDELMKEHPGSDIGGYRVDSYGEHAKGALDFMTTDEAQAAKVREKAFAHGAPYVIWKQQQWNADGSVSAMEDRGDPTQNHFDHVHIAPLPATSTPTTSTTTTSTSGGAAGGASTPSNSPPMMQVTPTGLVPAQRSASATDDYELWKHEHGDEADAEGTHGISQYFPSWEQKRWLNQQDRLQRKLTGGAIVVNPHNAMPVLPPLRRTARIASAEMIPGFVAEEGANPIDFSTPVFVHTNRHAVNHNKKVTEGVLNAPMRSDVWSIKQNDPETGIHVRGYAPEVHLVDNRFSVQQAGAQKFKNTQNPDGTGGQRVVHAGVYGYIAPPPDRPQDYSLTDYHPGFHTTFVHRDNGEPVHTADRVHFTPDARMYSAQADNWGRDHGPQLIFQPHPSVNAANLDTVGGEPQDRPPLWQDRTASLKKTARRAAMKKTARRRALKLAWGETEAPMAVDTLREEGTAPEDDDDDFERYVDPPKDLQTPDLSEAQQIDRQQELDGASTDQMGGVPGPADPAAQMAPQQPQQQFMTLQIPIPSSAPQVPQQAAPPMAAPMPPAMPEDPGMQQQGPPQQIAASLLDYFDNYYGRRVANWLDAIEAGRELNPAEAADYRRQAEKLSTLENGRDLSTTNRNPTKGTATMARNSIASRSKVARAGRRQHLAEGPLVDGGERGRNDQGEQEEAFISQTPPAVAGEYPDEDTHDITNTEHNLVARVQQGRAQLLRDAQALAEFQHRRTAGESGGPTATVVDPTVQTGPEGEALTGDDFVSADPNDGVVPTNPKDASLHAFRAFDGWLAQKTGKSSRRHNEATIKKAAAQFSREAGISPQALFPALGIVLREARKNEKQANTKGAKMRKRSNESLDVAAPDGRVDVEAPVENVTSAEAQASQFDLHDFGNNAGDDVAKPDLSTDQNWAPGEASKTSARVKTAGGLLAMRCAEGMIAAGLEPNSRERKYQLAAEFENMNRGLIQDRVALLERFAAVRQADLRRVASGNSRGAARSPIPAGLGGGTRTAGAGPRTAAHDPSNDSSLFI